MENIIQTLNILTDQPGVTGYEKETGITEVIFSIVSKIADFTKIDDFGNVISSIDGSSKKNYIIEAHMDEVGYMIDRCKNSKENLIPLGNIDKDEIDQDALETVLNLPEKDILSPKRSFKLEGDVVRAVALDNRVGCTALIEIMRRIVESKIDISVTFVFSAGEETDSSRWDNFPGDIYPIVMDAAYAEPIQFNNNKEKISIPILGKGCAIQHFGTDFVVNEDERKFLYDLASINNIPVQSEIPPKNLGRTNFSKMSKISGGKGVVVNIPVRDQHSNISTVNVNDLKSAVDLVLALLKTDTLTYVENTGNLVMKDY